MPTRTTRRATPGVNAGSMADIAFLLLIFFLVTTTILEDQGVLVRLPMWTDEPIDTQLPQHKVLTVKINKANDLLVEGEPATLGMIPELVRTHVINPDFPPKEAIVSLTHDRETNYDTYLQVYDALIYGYHLLRDERAEERYGVAYDVLSKQQQREIRDEIPLVISEAEPTAF